MKIKKQITFGDSEYLVVDLTEPLREDTEVYPGDPKPSKQVFSNIEKTGCEHYIYSLGDHNFHPHGDAPKHQNPELQDKGFETFNLGFCFNLACLVDLSISSEVQEFNNIKYLIEIKKQHLEPYKEIIADKGAVLIRTGYDKFIELNKPHKINKIPYLNKEAVDFLLSFKGLKVIGIDSLSPDPPESHYAHQKFKEKLIVESLVHLYEIPLDSRKNFDLQTTPLRIVGATGGPVVAYAFIKIIK